MAKKIPKKLFFKIGEVCELTDTQAYVLRFWESEFPQLAPRKNRSGQRIYSGEDIQIVEEIKRLLYDEGYTIAGARKRLDQGQDGNGGGMAEAAEPEGNGGHREPVEASVSEPEPKAPAGSEVTAADKTLDELRGILALMKKTDRKLSSS